MDKQQLIEQLKDIKHDVVIAICSIDDLQLYTDLGYGNFRRDRLIRHLLDTQDKLDDLVKQLATEKDD
jgi:hypothetical protein